MHYIALFSLLFTFCVLITGEKTKQKQEQHDAKNQKGIVLTQWKEWCELKISSMRSQTASLVVFSYSIIYSLKIHCNEHLIFTWHDKNY